jgi:hypothetical protein
MHPIERLRWIARAHGEAPSALAVEAAWTISELAIDDPAAVVTACRRLIEAHVTVGPLWWVAANLLASSDPDQAARKAVDELLSDTTGDMLAEELSARVSDEAAIVVTCPTETVLEALSYRPAAVVRVLGPSHARRAELRKFESLVYEVHGFEPDRAEEAVEGATVVLVEALAAGSAGVVANAGTATLARLARQASVPLWAVAGVGRVLHDHLLREMLRRAGSDVDLIGPELLEAVFGRGGLESPVEGLARSTCPPAPELLVRAG